MTTIFGQKSRKKETADKKWIKEGERGRGRLRVKQGLVYSQLKGRIENT